MRRFAPQLFAQVFCFPLILFFCSSAHGQLSIKRPNGQEQTQNQDWLVEVLRRDSARQYQRALLVAQLELRNDFRKLQILNNQLMARMFERPASTDQQLTQKEIRSSLGEIKKIAERLRLNLPIPKIKREETTESVSLSPGLLQLDKAVMSFVGNPLFQQPKVFDAELASRAGKDLSEILRLSDSLRKVAKEK